jgi:hypothetical protein
MVRKGARKKPCKVLAATVCSIASLSRAAAKRQALSATHLPVSLFTRASFISRSSTTKALLLTGWNL